MEDLENPAIVDSLYVGIQPNMGRILLRYQYKSLLESRDYDKVPIETITLILDRERVESLIKMPNSALPDIP